MTDQFVQNPKTGRLIKIGGETHKRMLRNGIFGGAENAHEVAIAPAEYMKELPPPPEGQYWRKASKHSEAARLCKIPKHLKSDDIIELTSKMRLKDLDLEETPENMEKARDEVQRMIFNESLKRERDAPMASIRQQTRPAPIKLPTRRTASKHLINSESDICSDKYTSHYESGESESDASNDDESYASAGHGPPIGLSRQQSTADTGLRLKPKSVGFTGKYRK